MQLLHIDVDGCMRVIHKRKRQLQLLKAVVEKTEQVRPLRCGLGSLFGTASRRALGHRIPAFGVWAEQQLAAAQEAGGAACPRNERSGSLPDPLGLAWQSLVQAWAVVGRSHRIRLVWALPDKFTRCPLVGSLWTYSKLWSQASPRWRMGFLRRRRRRAGLPLGKETLPAGASGMPG